MSYKSVHTSGIVQKIIKTNLVAKNNFGIYKRVYFAQNFKILKNCVLLSNKFQEIKIRVYASLLKIVDHIKLCTSFISCAVRLTVRALSEISLKSLVILLLSVRGLFPYYFALLFYISKVNMEAVLLSRF